MSIFLRDWFDAGSLTGWTVAGDVIATDYATDGGRLKLNSVADAAVSAKRAITPTSDEFLVEVDIEYSSDAGFSGYVELLDAANTPIVWFQVNGGNVTVDTDGDSSSSVAMAASVRRHLVIAVDRVNNEARFFLAAEETAVGPWYGWSQIGTTKAYSGTDITQIQFRTSTTGQMYADQLHVFSPDYFIIGDSISDGKSLWSVKPDYRLLLSNPNPSTPPHYKLEQLLGAGTDYVANRGFGAAKSGDVNSWVQSSVIDQYAKKCIIHVGINDICNGVVTLAALQSNIGAIIGKLQAGGITGENIILCKIDPAAWFDGYPSGDEDNRLAYNNWLYNKACEVGARLVFNSEALNDNNKLTQYKRLKSTYRDSGGVHLNATGNGALAQAIHDSRPPGGVLRPASYDLFPASYLGSYNVTYVPAAQLSGAIICRSTVTAEITTSIRLSAAIAARSTLTGALNSGAVLQGSLQANCTLTADLTASGAVTLQDIYSLVLTRVAANEFQAGLAALQGDITSLLSYAVSMSKWKNNKLSRASVAGTVETWVLYDDDGITPLLTWTHDTSTKVRGKAT